MEVILFLMLMSCIQFLSSCAVVILNRMLMQFLSYLLLLVLYAHCYLSSALMLPIDCLETDFNLLIISVTY